MVLDEHSEKEEQLRKKVDQPKEGKSSTHYEVVVRDIS